MNGFSTNKTTVLLDFRPLGSHSASAASFYREADIFQFVFYTATLLAEFSVCNLIKRLGVWTCCPFRGKLTSAQGSFGAIPGVRYRLDGASNDCFSEEKTGSSLRKSQDPVRALLIISVKLECSNWVRHLSQH